MGDIEDWWAKFDTSKCMCDALLPNGQPLYPNGCEMKNHLMKDDDRYWDSLVTAEIERMKESYDNLPVDEPIQAFCVESNMIFTERQLFVEALCRALDTFSVSKLLGQEMIHS